MAEPRFLCENSSKSILDTLKASQIWNGCACHERVAEIKSGANYCCSYGFRSLSSKRSTNVTEGREYGNNKPCMFRTPAYQRTFLILYYILSLYIKYRRKSINPNVVFEDSWRFRYQEIISKNLKNPKCWANPTAKIRQNRDPTRPDRGSIRPVDNSVYSHRALV